MIFITRNTALEYFTLCLLKACGLRYVQDQCVKSLSRVRLSTTLWTVAYHAPPPMGFSSQEYWSVLPFSSPGDLPDPGTKPVSPELAGRFFTH